MLKLAVNIIIANPLIAYPRRAPSHGDADESVTSPPHVRHVTVYVALLVYHVIADRYFGSQVRYFTHL